LEANKKNIYQKNIQKKIYQKKIYQKNIQKKIYKKKYIKKKYIFIIQISPSEKTTKKNLTKHPIPSD